MIKNSYSYTTISNNNNDNKKSDSKYMKEIDLECISVNKFEEEKDEEKKESTIVIKKLNNFT